MVARRAVLAAPLLALAALAGCMLGGAPSPSRELSLAQADDVPVPAGLALETASGRSFSYAEGGEGDDAILLAHLEYLGLPSPEDVLAFYEREMPRPPHRWKAGARESRSAEETSILFTKGRERCRVAVRRTLSGSHLVVERNTGDALGP